jgi:hypothetical protein
MSVLHAVPSGLPTGTVPGKVAGDDWRADHLSIPEPLTMWSNGSASLTTLTASLAAGTEWFSGAKATRGLTDLSAASQGRLVMMIGAVGNKADASIKLSYRTTQASTWGAGTDAGPTCVFGAGTANTLVDGGWMDLAPDCRVDNVYLAILVGVAFGTTAPSASTIRLYLR